MKKLIYISALFICHLSASGQSKSAADREQVLNYFQAQQYEAASKYLDSLYKGKPEGPEQLLQSAYAHMMAGNYSKAETQYLSLRDQQPGNIAVVNGLAQISMKRGNVKKAVAYYLEAISLDSSNVTAYRHLARLNSAANKETYLNYLKKANTLQPANAEVAADLCNFYLKDEKYPEAEAVLSPAITADSNNLKLVELKMPIQMAAKKYEAVVATGQFLLANGDSSTYVLNHLGKTQLQLLEYQKALDCFLRINPNEMDEEILAYQIAQSYRGVKDFKSAIPYIEKSIGKGISSRTASYYGILGDSYERINKNQEANTAYKEGLKFENNGSLYYNIARVYENKLNDKKNAIEYYTQYQKTLDQDKQAKTIKFIKGKIEELKR